MMNTLAQIIGVIVVILLAAVSICGAIYVSGLDYTGRIVGTTVLCTVIGGIVLIIAIAITAVAYWKPSGFITE